MKGPCNLINLHVWRELRRSKPHKQILVQLRPLKVSENIARLKDLSAGKYTALSCELGLDYRTKTGGSLVELRQAPKHPESIEHFARNFASSANLGKNNLFETEVNLKWLVGAGSPTSAKGRRNIYYIEFFSQGPTRGYPYLDCTAHHDVP